jgi:hypothetical protein
VPSEVGLKGLEGMSVHYPPDVAVDSDIVETREWIESFDALKLMEFWNRTGSTGSLRA